MEQLRRDLKEWLHQRAASSTTEKARGYSILLEGDAAAKNEAAQAVSKESGKELHRVDLSKIVSKYIGETEKNLEALFAKAESHNWILFFDEADALFGKRTNVKDAHDRYANIETSYLLRKIESHPCIVILSSNKKENIDDAFIRRLRRVISFPPSSKK